MKHTMFRALGLTGGLALAVAGGMTGAPTAMTTPSGSAIHPTVAEFQQLTTSTTPPTQAQCASVGRRCFTPQSPRGAYNVNPLLTAPRPGTS